MLVDSLAAKKTGMTEAEKKYWAEKKGPLTPTEMDKHLRAIRTRKFPAGTEAPMPPAPSKAEATKKAVAKKATPPLSHADRSRQRKKALTGEDDKLTTARILKREKIMDRKDRADMHAARTTTAKDLHMPKDSFIRGPVAKKMGYKNDLSKYGPDGRLLPNKANPPKPGTREFGERSKKRKQAILDQIARVKAAEKKKKKK